MNKPPTVSIIMPTYNRARILKNAISSVLAQSYRNWELIIVDDGSTDATKTSAHSFMDRRIKYYFQKNRGAGAARNHGLSRAKGKWIAYLDSDNEFLPDYLQTMLRWLDKTPQATFAFPRAKRMLELYKGGRLVKAIDDSADMPKQVSLKDIFMKKFHFDTNGLMHQRQLFDEGIRWDENLHAMEDWDFVMTIGERYPEGCLYVPVVLYDYHQRYGGDGIVSNSTYQDWADVFEYIYQKHKHDKMLKGQTWYPQRVEKWKRLQKEFDAGKQPPYQLYYFQNIIN